jgi:hypothetical protein
MTKNDPFGFDMSVSGAKKRMTRGRRAMSGASETSTRPCDHAGCEERGAFRAPKAPGALDDYYWFCKEHVREYNLKWNFFEGVTEKDFLRQIDRDRVWGRATRPFGQRAEEARAWSRLGVDDPHQVLGENATRNPGHAPGSRRLPPTERRAVEILDIRDTATRKEIRAAYKALVKVLHPDMNGGDRSHEEQLSEVVWAWEQLRESRNFKDD